MLHFSCAGYGNPSSLHQGGRAAAKALEKARAEVAAQIGARPEGIFFTSSGTEADNWAIYSAAAAGAARGKKHIIASSIEHHAILEPLLQLKKHRFDITLLGVTDEGIVQPNDVEDAIRPDTALVSVMYANNEIGTIQPISRIGDICQSRGVPFHTDAVQAVGHIPVDIASQHIDMLSLSAHKFHGPTGVGALYCRPGIPLTPFLLGGEQEQGKRAGTENICGVVGMAAALEYSCRSMDESGKRITAMRDKLIHSIGAIPGARLTGSVSVRLPGNVHFCFDGIGSAGLLMVLDMHGICASSGAACASRRSEPSHVLKALGLPEGLARGALRLSLSGDNIEKDVEYIATKLPQLVKHMQGMGK